MSSDERGKAGGRQSYPQSKRRRRIETNRPEEVIGDECVRKDEGCIRIMGNNINGLSIDNNFKINNLKSIIDDYNVDIFGCQEVNVCWNLCRFKDRLFQKPRGWTTLVAFNTTEACKRKHQWGELQW